ncbi:hypothetical protein EST38_g8816 [Candolleomyces aberdarensis]|uniref:Uncharacterized protein n=1 Tax=Candolleomyces aberdarensis TaxID=2316362 RepID=A0A4Q2DDC7_9AGAR|nr:hypothetical protein EST38_g8816 [Candolleomyces aberdarensis]
MANPEQEQEQSSEGALTEAELTELQTLVSGDLKALLQDTNPDEEINYADLLQRLNATDTMARGVEQKLDNILENLDALLDSLGPDPPSDGPTTDSTATANEKEGTSASQPEEK